jgi:hypothetical protein
MPPTADVYLSDVVVGQDVLFGDAGKGSPRFTQYLI